MASETEVEIFEHLGRTWRVIEWRGSFFLRDDQDSDVGPYSTAQEARHWALEIVRA